MSNIILSLIETLETTAEKINWTQHESDYAGFYEFDNDKIVIMIDTFNIDNKFIGALSFKVNGSMDFTGNDRTSLKLISTIVNASVDKINSLNLDLVMLMVSNTFGAVESRKKTYSAISRRMTINGKVNFISEWINYSNGCFLMLGRNYQPSNDEIEEIKLKVKNK